MGTLEHSGQMRGGSLRQVFVAGSLPSVHFEAVLADLEHLQIRCNGRERPKVPHQSLDSERCGQTKWALSR